MLPMDSQDDHNDGTDINSTSINEIQTKYQELVLEEGETTETAGNAKRFRSPEDRPVYKLSVKLIDTYKHVNEIYYEAKARRLREQVEYKARGGVYNDGYDDISHDYILQGNELFGERYILKDRVGQGSFGQVVCAYDQETRKEVAIKIIKSRRPFMLQAQTEIELLTLMAEEDRYDRCNIVRLLHKFIFRNHQCLVFEILSYNLYELLKNTRFRGVSLNLIRKFSKQILKSLEFLASPEVNIIHCDLKPENILLRHPKRSAIKLIDFGSSCIATKKTYTYIQSRFYRSPEILMGLPYDQKIDVWSLGCVLVEMHTGQPLFGGVDQADQMCRIVDVLGMPPLEMLEASPQKNRSQFFEFIEADSQAPIPTDCDTSCIREREDGSGYYILKRANRDTPPSRDLSEILGVYEGGPSGRRLGEPGHSEDVYLSFLDFISMMLRYLPRERVSAEEALSHIFITSLTPTRPEGDGYENYETTPNAGTPQWEGDANEGDGNDSVLRRGRQEEESQQRIRSRSAPSGHTRMKLRPRHEKG